MRDSGFFDRLDAVFDEALALDAAARAELVETLTRTEPDLAEELTQLLRHAELADTFLEQPSAAESRDRLLSRAMGRRDGLAADDITDHVGELFGAYRAEEQIARGLRSVVYKARRIDDEWTQDVAIKVLTRGFDSDDVLRRFLAERQILTVLRHRNIATLLDGGIACDGAPYFVMEYIDGCPVTEYCRANELPLAARVHLCREICAAVAYAHRHMVVHRDLKPSNILVTAEGKVKLLDFGIAKLLADGPEPALDPALAAQTVDVVRPMTPRYASPEQVGDGMVTSATDVYQLGLVFTETLAGVDQAREALAIDPQHGPRSLPSRIPSPGDGSLPYAPRELRGDLDWILLKALETDPEHRYASASELGIDLECHVESRPVRARRATAAYILGKFVRRWPVVSASLGLGLAAVLVFTVTLAHFNRQLETERAAAVAAAERAEEVKNLLVSFIQSPNPYTGRGADARVGDVLLNSEEIIARELEGRPELQAELYGVLGDVYQSLTLHERAARSRELELERLAQLGLAESFRYLQVRRELAQAVKALGRLDEARSSLEDVEDALAQRFPGHAKERATVAITLSNFHTVYGRPEEGIPLLERAAELAEQVENDPLFLASVIEAQAFGLRKAGRYEEARDRYVQALEILVEQLGVLDTRVLMLKAAQSANLTNLGLYRESLRIYAEILAALEQRLGPTHREVLNILNNQAYTYRQSGNYAAAADIHRDILERRRAKFGDVHRDVADSWQNIGAALSDAGQYDEALDALNQAARIYPQVNQSGSPLTAFPHVTISIIHGKRGDTTQQAEHARQALAILEGNVRSHHPALLRSQCLLGDALAKQGRRDEGVSMMMAAVAGLEQHAGRFQSHLDGCRDALDRASQTRKG